MSFRKKLILGVLFSQIFVLFFTIIFHYQKTVQQEKEAFSWRCKEIAKIIKSAVETDLSSNKLAGIKHVFEDTVNEAGIVAYMSLMKGSELVQYVGGKSYIPKRAKLNLDEDESQDKIYEIIESVHHGKQEYVLAIGFNSSFLEKRMRNSLTSHMISFLVGLICLLLILAVMSFVFSQRMRKLIEACEKIGEGSFDTDVEVRGNDEISTIGKAINAMKRNLITLQFEKIQQQAVLASSAQFSTLGEMAAGIAHEINNPLFIINGTAIHALDVSKERDLSKTELTKIFTRIERTSERIAKIVRGLQLVARDSSDEKPVRMKISSLVEDTLGLCLERFKSNGVELRLNIPNDIETDVRPVQLSQVILNLLNISFEALSELDEKWVQIDIKTVDGKVQIQITGSGHGNPLEKGTGLGLSISKGIVHDHGGELFYNTESKNTQFVIQIPLKA